MVSYRKIDSMHPYTTTTAVPTCRLSHISWLYVILWISVGELRYSACPPLVKQKVLAMRMSVRGR